MKFAKRTQYIILATFTLLYLSLICIAFLNLNNLAEADTPYINDVTIVIDPGHGGEDGGATANGIIEKDINLSISNILTDIFKTSGYNVITIRSTDTMINSEGNTLRERKVSDMKNRLQLYNSNPNNIVISIHQNKFVQEKYFGTQVFYSKNSPESLLLAEFVKDSVVSLLQPDNSRECKPSDSGIYLLHNAQNPSIIVECGFISNGYEAEKLKTKEYQKQLAFSIYLGFMNYYINRG